MSNKFSHISYLKKGNPGQQLAFRELTNDGLWEALNPFRPRLCGTIPIEIDIPGSDLDVICEAKNLDQLAVFVEKLLGGKANFKTKRKQVREKDSLIVRYQGEHFPVELFAQNVPVEEQHAYRHMLIEDRILDREGEDFRKEIINLKREGIKTEPAFAHLLGLEGDPYLALLVYGKDNFGL